MGPIVLYTHTKNQEDPQSLGGEKDKKNLFWTQHLIPYDQGLKFLQKNHLAQMMGPIVLYTHAKQENHRVITITAAIGK